MYYPAGGAMRVNETLYFVVGDNLGSAVLTLDSSGNTVGQERYYPFGATRFASGTIQTDRLYTGQRSNSSLGLMDYRARFYDGNLNRFISPDTIIPSYANPQSLNRYSYGLNNPVKYTDPSGHVSCYGANADDGPQCFGRTTQEKLQRLHIQATGLNDKEMAAVARVGINVAVRFAFTTGGSAGYALNSVFKGGLEFEKSSEQCTTCWGETKGTKITIYANANVDSITYGNFLVHEMGHAFDNAGGSKLTAGYTARLGEVATDNWTPMPTGNEGYASPSSMWIQGHHSDGVMEQTADMFLGWTYNSWSLDQRRARWMDLWMPYLLRGASPDYLTQYYFDEGPAP